MTTITGTRRAQGARTSAQDYPPGNSRFDWMATGLSAWMALGVYVEIWASSHGFGSESFLSPTTLINLGAAGVSLIFFLFHQIRAMRKGYSLRRALPRGYGLCLVGLAFLILGIVLHFPFVALFGEPGELVFLSPMVLVNVSGALLIVSGPIRSAWARLNPAETRGWKALAPLIVSTTCVLSTVTFVAQSIHPIMEPFAAKVSEVDPALVSDIYVMNADGTHQLRLTASTEVSAWSADWSPDGHQIVFSQGLVNEETNLYVMNADGSDLSVLTDMPGSEYVPAWSPDGQRIAFVSYQDGKQVIDVINADGSDLQHLTPDTVLAYGPAWSPDSRQIVYTSNASGTDHLYLIGAGGGSPAQLTNNGSHNWGAAWSPDGSQIFFCSWRDNNTDVYAIRPDGSGETRLTSSKNSEYWPAWSPDGSRITFVTQYDENKGVGPYTSDVYVMNADGSQPHNVSQNAALEVSALRWSPDGKSILFSATGHSTLLPPYYATSLGIVSFVFQTGLLLAVALFLIRTWTLPFGALTFMATANGLLMSLANDKYILALAWLAAGLAADLYLWRFRPSAGQYGRFWAFGFGMPVVLTGCYFLLLQLTEGVGWNVHLWLGAILITSIGGLGVTRLALSPLQASENCSHSSTPA